ncbi:MAG: PIN domain-containing protein [Candidatus Diapherotrites archaeon]|nr:PIN domain-containing protein [Candidatus Diapherotrites archaeon]
MILKGVRMSGTALIDTNILVYFADANEKEKHAKAQRFMREVEENKDHFLIAMQNLREFGSVMIQKKGTHSQEVGDFISFFCEMFPIVLVDDPISIREAVAICGQQRLDYYDVVLAQTALRNKTHVIYTENVKDFNNIPGITAINPIA